MEKEEQINNQRSFGMKFKDFMTPSRYILLGFIGLILFGAVMLVLPVASKDGKSMGFLNALFMATSSVCVTGLVVVDPGTQLTIFGQIVLLLLIQAGGLGFMTTASMMLMLIGKKFSLRERMTMQENLSQDNLKGVVKMTKRIVIFTFMVESFGALMLMSRFIPMLGAKGIYISLFLAVSAFCNAGLDILGGDFGAFSSVEAFSSDPVVLLTIAGLVIVGGLGFIVFSDIFNKKNNKPLSLHTRVAITMTTVLLVLGTVVFLGVEYNNPLTLGNMSTGDKILNAFFQSVTTRTAGFASINQGDLTEGSKMISVIFMFIGASPASTGGGVKTTTIFIMVLLLVSAFRDEDEIVYKKETIGQKFTRKAGALIIFALFVVIIQSLVIWGSEKALDISFLDCVFESVSAFGTVGLSTGITTSLGVASKITLCMTMFIGRLGPLTIGSAVMRKAKKSKPNIKYPEAKILVG